MIKHFNEIRSLISTIEGLISPDEEAYLFNLTFNIPQEGTIVEIGSHMGKSSACLGFGCLNTKRKLYCVDPWLNETAESNWMTNIARMGLTDCVIPIKGFSGDVFQTWNKPIDLIFIDGAHGVTDVMKDFALTYPFVKYQGTMAFHDYGHPVYPGVEEFWNVAKNLFTSQFQVGTIVSGIKIFIK